jgi:hypothetical protein
LLTNKRKVLSKWYQPQNFNKSLFIFLHFLSNQTVYTTDPITTNPAVLSSNSPKEARSCQFPEPGGLPRPLLEEYSEGWGEEGDKANPGGGGTVYDSLRFPSASYFLGLPLFFFPNNSPLPGVVFAAVFIVVVVVVVAVVVTPRLVSTAMFTTTWGGATRLNGAGGESVSEFPVDPENVFSFSSIKLCLFEQ